MLDFISDLGSHSPSLLLRDRLPPALVSQMSFYHLNISKTLSTLLMGDADESLWGLKLITQQRPEDTIRQWEL